MIKLVRTDDTEWNERVSTMIDVTRFGARISQIKTAGAVLAKEFAELRPSEKYAWVHTLAIGSTEAYGPNRNADGFSEYWLKKKHDTFVKNAHLYRNHANKDPRKAIGIIKHSAYNPDMRRVELIIGYDKQKAADIVEKLARGEDIAGSMGCRIDYDVCSICGNKAKSPAFYCEHMKKYAAQILEDGRQVYVDNPNPEFFDWSYVDRPADRIAFSFSKVASARRAWKSAVDLAHEAGLIYPANAGNEKISVLKKLSEIEKRVPVTLTPLHTSLLQLLQHDNDIDEPIMIRLRLHNPCDVFSTLHRHKILLSPKNFLQLVAPATADASAFDDIAASVQAALPGIFKQLLGDPLDDVGTLFDGDCGCGMSSLPSSIVEPLVDRYSFAEPAVTKRIYRIVIISKPARRSGLVLPGSTSDRASKRHSDDTNSTKSEKTSSTVMYPVHQYPEIGTLAKLYARYKLAAASYPTNVHDPLFTHLVVFQNFQHIFH